MSQRMEKFIFIPFFCLRRMNMQRSMERIIDQYSEGACDNGLSKKSQVYQSSLPLTKNPQFFCEDLVEILGGENTSCNAGARLDSIRREIIRIFNEGDSLIKERNGKRENFCERLARLSNEGKIPKKIVILIRLINSFRNLAVYDNCKISAGELALMEEAWILVRGWWENSEKK